MQLYVMRKSDLRVTVLPEKVSGQHTVFYNDSNGHDSVLLTVDAQNDNWLLHPGECIETGDGNGDRAFLLNADTVFRFRLTGGESVLLYAAPDSPGSGLYTYYSASPGQRIRIGSGKDNELIYRSSLVADRACTIDCYDGKYRIRNALSDRMDSSAMCYVDQRRLSDDASAGPGSVLFLYGLKIVFGNGFIAVNNPSRRTKAILEKYVSPPFHPVSDEEKLALSLSGDSLFSSAPRIYRKEECREFNIDSPPQPDEGSNIPWFVMVGPAMTMAFGSVFSSIFTMSNLLSTGGSVMGAMPSLVMSVTMVAGMAVWPSLSRRIQRIHREQKNRLAEEDYLNYLRWIYAEIQKTADLQFTVANQNNPSLRSCIDIIRSVDSSLWERSRRHEDFLNVMIGKGSLPLNAKFNYPERSYSSQITDSAREMYNIMEQKYIVENVPITLPLSTTGAIGVIGDRRETICFIRALLIELTALHNYEDLHLAFIFDKSEASAWQFAKWIPHVWTEGKTFRLLASTPEELKNLSEVLRARASEKKRNDARGPHYIIVSADKSLTERSSFITGLYDGETTGNMTVLTLYNRRHFLPKECRYVIDLSSEKPRLFDYDDESGVPLTFNDYVSCPDDPTDLFIQMSNIRLGIAEQLSSLPSRYTLMEMCGVGRVEHIDILGNWDHSNPVDSLSTQIGIDSSGYPITLDIHEKAHGPHGLIAGMTGSGKSEFIISYIANMALHYSPEDVAFVLIDFKGGGMADVFRDLPHTAGLITNLDGNELKRSFLAIESELQKRQKLFKEISESKKISNIDIYKYQKLRQTDKNLKPLPHLIIISDEFAELKQQHRDFMEQLIRIARIGRSLGVHLILATQKPDGIVDDQIKSNIHFKVCLKVQDKSDSKNMIGRPDAAEINTAGRFYYQVGNDELFEFGQSPWSGALYEPSDAPKVNISTDITALDLQGQAILRASPAPAPRVPGVPEKQIDAAVAYISSVAGRKGVRAEKLWLKPIDPPKAQEVKTPSHSTEIVPFVLNPTIGVYDDLQNQRHIPLTVPFTTGGNALLYGASGTGALEFINTMLVELMSRHSPEELSLYLLDYDAGTLSAFESAPHTQSFASSAVPGSGEKVIAALSQQLKERKDALKEYGGDYRNYIKSSGKTMPNILLIIHNYQNFQDSFGDARTRVAALAREGTQYGLYVLLSGTTGNSIPYTIQPLFHNIYTLQQNNEDQYREILGKTGGIVPENYRGRGLVRVDGTVCEFQTTFVFEGAGNIYNVLRDFCAQMSEKYGIQKAEPRKAKTFDWDAFQAMRLTPKPDGLPIALDPASGSPLFLSVYDTISTLILYDKAKKPAYRGIMKLLGYAEGRILYLGTNSTTMQQAEWESVPPTRLSESIEELWSEMLRRAQAGQEAKRTDQPIPDFEHLVYVLDGVSVLMDWLPDASRQHLVTLICGLSTGYHIHFVLVDSAENAGRLMGPTYLQRGIPYAQGVLLSDNPSALMLFPANIADVPYRDREERIVRAGEAFAADPLIIPEEDG